MLHPFEKIVQFREADVISINETHLKNKEKLTLNGYQWFGHNRSIQHTRAKRSYGGVGFFIRDSICQEYELCEDFSLYNDMYGIRFTNKTSGYTFMVFTVYLPPEGSPFYCDAPDFFNKLLLEVYKE